MNALCGGIKGRWSCGRLPYLACANTPRKNHYMSTQIKDSQPVADTYGDQDSLAVHDAVDTTTTEQPNGAADPTIQGLQDPRVQLARQGVDISLRSLQVWADLARQRGVTPPGRPMTCSRSYWWLSAGSSTNSSPPSANARKNASLLPQPSATPSPVDNAPIGKLHRPARYCQPGKCECEVGIPAALPAHHEPALCRALGSID